MPKKSSSKRVGISISLDESLAKKLNDFCKQNFNAERSAVIEEALRKFLEEINK